MKKLIFLFLILTTITLWGCSSSGGGSNLIGTWNWIQQQTQPGPQENRGNMVVTNVSGSNFIGTITWTSPNPSPPYNFEGIITGVTARVAYTHGNIEEVWTINFTGNSFSGNWVGTDGTAGTITGTKVS
jgi:hypothetical protein